jgi:hypothetical protein
LAPERETACAVNPAAPFRLLLQALQAISVVALRKKVIAN